MKKRFLNLFLLIIFSIVSALPLYAQEKIEMTNEDLGVYVFKINTKKYGSKIKPFYAPRLTTSQKVYDDNCFDLVVNGGFFDVKNGKSVSYVTVDNELVGNIDEYSELVNSLKNENRYDKVASRTEFRILENKRHKLKFDIARHNKPIPKKWKIKHSIQAGPMLTPNMDLVSEGFVNYNESKEVIFQSVDILKRRERTVIGLKGKYLYIVIFTKNHKVDANEMRDYLKDNLKLKKAMAFDGGLSTSLNYKNKSIGSLGKYQRRVKSFLVIER